MKTWTVAVLAVIMSMSALPFDVTAVRTGEVGLNLAFQVRSGGLYRLEMAPSPDGVWITQTQILATARGTATVSVPILSAQKFYRVARILGIDGAITSPKSGAVVSNDIIVLFETISQGSTVSYAWLEAITPTTTNVVATSDEPSTGRFVLDTTRLQNVPTTLVLHMEDEFGNSVTRTGAREGYSDELIIMPNNALVVTGLDRPIGWKIAFSFSSRSGGAWRVHATNSAGVLAHAWSGVSGANQSVSIEDASAPYEGYTNRWFDIRIESGGVVRVKRVPVETRRFPYPESFIGYQRGIITNEISDYFFALDEMAFGFSQYGDSWFVSNLVRGLPEPQRINTNEWQIIAQYLREEYIRGPSHIYMFSDGFRGGVGNNGENSPGFTTMDITTSNRPTFVFFDGCNAPMSIVHTLVDLKEHSLDEMKTAGRYPTFGVFFRGLDWDAVRNDHAVSENYTTYLRRFFSRILKKDFLSGLAINSFEEGLQYASVLDDGATPNPVARYIRVVGCREEFVDQVIWDSY